MGKMKWIYQMVQDGTSEEFIKQYLQAKLQDKDGFVFDSQFIDVKQGRSIMKEMKRANKEYDIHIDRQAELDQAAIEL